MATGDDAAAAGMAVVDGATTNARDIDTEINRSRDYIAQGKGATDAATVNKVVKRDANGRAKFATPSVAADAATKGYVDAAVPNPLTVAKGGTGATTAADARTNLDVVGNDQVIVSTSGGSVANKIPRYDASGRIVAATPVAANQAASKAYVDAQTFSGGTVSGQILLPNAYAASSGYVVAYINGDGRISKGASSRRFKKNIRNFRNLAGSLFGVKLREFQMKEATGDEYHVGLIAEELRDNDATARYVVLDAEGQPESYDMIGILLAMVYELNDRVTVLEARSS